MTAIHSGAADVVDRRRGVGHAIREPVGFVDRGRDEPRSRRGRAESGEDTECVAAVGSGATHIVDRRRSVGDAIREPVGFVDRRRDEPPVGADDPKAARSSPRSRSATTASEQTAITIALRGPTFMNVCG